jgi:uncharacterized phage protein gp47/JayE
MNLNLKGFAQLVQDMGAALQSSASNLVDVSVGSVVRAIFEANASVVLWIQWLVLQVLQATRASTSQGADLDSWMADFGQIRLSGIPSSGMVTFSRFGANLSGVIPTSTIIKTADGSLSFSVTEDQSLSTWKASASGYVLPVGVSSIDLPVTCNSEGTIGNILAGTLTVIAASLPGIDQVNNASPISNGTDAESDDAFRKRFQTYLASRSRATIAAVQNAIANVRQGLDVAIVENTAANGATKIGSFIVVVDDGTGFPASVLLSAVASAVDFVRPIGTTFTVIPPQVLPVTVSLIASISPTENSSACIAVLQNSISNYLNSLPIGKGASVTRVAQSAYLGESGVENITEILLNGGSSDVIAPPLTVVKAGQIVVVVANGG